jgi:probable phosphoglycerate mutase
MNDDRFVYGMTPFYFVRHGQTPQNERGIVQGQSDTELNRNGISSAEKSALALQSIGLRSIYASPLKRAWRTATIIKALTGAPPLHPLPGLMERHWGKYEGLPKTQRPNETDPDTAETLATFTDRVLAAMTSITGPPPVLVVAHSGVFRILCRHAGLRADLKLSLSSGEALRFNPPTTQRPRWQISMV